MERDTSEYIVATMVKPMCLKKTKHNVMRLAIIFTLEELFIL